MTDTETPLIDVSDLTKRFRRGSRETVAVRDVSFTMARGRNLGIVGESGSGKSTLASMVMGALAPTSGSITLDGEDMTAFARTRSARRARAKLVQMVYQDPFGSLDPRQSVHSALGEVLAIHGTTDRTARDRRIAELCDLVGLTQAQRARSPRDLSGGQRQRVAIARALAVTPRLIILDEAVAALDVSIQAQILNLLREVQGETNTDFVLISHDLAVVAYLTEDVIVMRQGQIVERGATNEVLEHPNHEYTRLLRDSVPNTAWREPGTLERIAARVCE